MIAHKPVLILFILCICYCLIQPIVSLTIKIDPNREECFYDKVDKAHVKVMLQYQVSSGGFLDIDTTIYGPTGDVVHRTERESEGKFTFNAEKEGVYKFCFSNLMSTLTSKTVSFSIVVGDLLDPNLAKVEHLDPIEKSIMRLSEGLAQIQNEQKLLRMREHSHRDLVEETNTRILWWSIFELVALVAVSFFQVFYLRRFLDTKRSSF